MTLGGPWLTSAVFCEAADTPTMAVVERVVIAADRPLRLVLLLLVVRGDCEGPFGVVIETRSPGDEIVGTIELTVDLPNSPNDSGRVLVPIELAAVQDGVYWFSVVFGERLVTRVPLRVVWPKQS